MHVRPTISSGQPFNLPQNGTSNSVSGSWTSIGTVAPGRGVRVQGVYWSCSTPGVTLKIRDNTANIGGGHTNVVWYEAVCLGGDPALDQLVNGLTLYAPFEYFDTEGGNVIIIYGEYV